MCVYPSDQETEHKVMLAISDASFSVEAHTNTAIQTCYILVWQSCIKTRKENTKCIQYFAAQAGVMVVF